MKRLAVILCLSVLSTGAFAQGLVNFFNNNATQVSSGATGNTTAISGAVGAYYFGLLTNGGSGSFVFTGIYATNQTSLGRFNGGANVPVPGWAAGDTRTFVVAGWSASLGPTFNSSWITKQPGGATDFFGISSSGSGQAGGFNGTGTLPNLNIFGGATGIQAGFNLAPGGGGPIVPEPSSMALAGLGAAALLIFRRRK